MTWPLSNDFNEAVQFPQTAFDDGELKVCVPETDALGLPRPRSGAFAVAYRLRAPGVDWAVKCFTKEPPVDLQQRYAAIAAYLAQQRCAYTVPFIYLPRGVRIGSEWFPVVKMQWAEGEPLHVYVQKNLNNREALAKLAIQWVEMIDWLQRARIGHGDLQHGNILIVKSAIKLVDYDGMYVPALAGRRSTELGLPNYQHPRRSANDFDPRVDLFSAWVIYVSLVALSNLPQLWKTFQGGDDCLLFRRSDFEDPDHSALMRALERCQSPQVRDLVACFRAILDSSPLDLPGFGNAVLPPVIASVPSPPGALPDWLRDHVSPTVPGATAPVRETPSDLPADPSWVLDFITQPAPAYESPATKPSRSRMLLTGAVFALLVAISITSWVGAFICLAMVVLGTVIIYDFYRRNPITHDRRQTKKRVAEMKDILPQVQRETLDTSARIRNIRLEEQNRVAAIRSQLKSLATEESKAIAAADSDLMRDVASQRQANARLGQQEQSELVSLQAGALVATLSAQLGSLQGRESAEFSTALKKKQEEYVQTAMEAHRLEVGTIAGIGAYIVNNLAAEGIRTAADCQRLVYRKISAVGPRREQAILSWAKQIESRMHSTVPTALDRNEENAIRSKYGAEKMRLQAQLSSAQATLKAQEEAIRRRYAIARGPVLAEIDRLTNACDRKKTQIRADMKSRTQAFEAGIATEQQKANSAVLDQEKRAGAQRQAVRDASWKLAKARAELGRFKNATFPRYFRRIVIGG